jgi:hypothetical protein
VPLRRDARAEAQARLGDDGPVACVLEPSPPAATVEPFADDPAVPPSDWTAAVTPTTAGTTTWDDLARARPELAAFAADHWLGAWRSLPSLPPRFASSRAGLHVLAFYVLSPARRAVNGKIGLRWTAGGFGTPFFADDTQVRVEGGHVVVQTAGDVRADELSTVRRAAALVGREPRAGDRGEFDAPELPELDAPLDIDPLAVAFLDAWFGLGASVLEQLRVDAAGDDPSLVQLWPEHFDLAVEAGVEGNATRATYGFSPGDDAHDEPYLYVGPWRPVDRAEPYWNDHAFNGASMPLAKLGDGPRQRERALAFLREGRAISSATRP